MIRTDFWQGRRVLVTGHTGFKGTWLSLWLDALGATVCGYALAPQTRPSMFEATAAGETMRSVIADVRDAQTLAGVVDDFAPEVVLHLAAQPLVRRSYREPLETYAVNVMGTAHLLEACRGCASVRSVVVVTTDKCYENREWVWGYREDEPMGGHDPYSSSKGCAELVTAAYRRSFFHEPGSAAIASARAGNVIGGGDWSEDRLIPDIVRSFGAGEPVIIRSPNATRPWQHVLEPLAGYLVLAQGLFERGHDLAEGWNFGPEDADARPVSWIVERMVQRWGGAASWRLDQKANPHEATELRLDIAKAKRQLGWRPRLSLDVALTWLIDWYKTHGRGEDVRALSRRQIAAYTDLMRQPDTQTTPEPAA